MDVKSSTAPLSTPALKLGEQLSLDFVNSLACLNGNWLEWLADGQALLRWLEGADAIDAKQRKEALHLYSKEQLDAVALHARDLREWYRALLFKVKEKGSRSINEANVERLNDVLSTATTSPRFGRNKEQQLELKWEPRGTSALGLLGPVAQAMAGLLCEEDVDLVSRCENETCTLWFYDRTKNHHRRWCSQAVCGNRAKVAAFRQRRKGSVT
jgi:predicted RNA-binding Zn ribbon-like protein